MATLDKNILNEFAKTVTAEQQKDDGILVYGIVTRLTDDGAIVRLDGKTDNTLTPCATGVSVTVGDRVTVNIGRNQAVIIANSTTNPTPGADSKLVGSGKIIADYINASFVKTDVLEANYVATTYLEANYLKTGQLDAQYATIAELIANYIKTTQLNAEVANLGYLKADSATITNLVTETAKVQDLTAEQLSAATGYVGSLVSSNITANDIEADHATIGSLDTNYAQIDLANVTNAWIQNGTIKDAAISDAQIIGVSANKLTAGTIDASNITVTNLNASNITTGTINGQRIGAGSLSLDKLAEDVYTEDEVDSMLSTMQSEIDGAIETFTGTVVPTLNNYPASLWTDTYTKSKHIGDIYYVVNAGQEADGYCYRFAYDNTTSAYKWSLIQDSDVTAALSRLQTAEGKIEGLETFESNTAVWKNETDESISTLITSTTNLSASIGPINLIPESYDSELKHVLPWTNAGITWTVDKDGAITATGTATAITSFYITQSIPSRNTNGVPCIPIVLNKTYTFSGCPAGSSSTYFIRVQYRSTSNSIIGSSIYDYGSGVTFTPTNSNCYGVDIYIYINSGYACPAEGLTFKPMLEYGNEVHSYIPPRAGLKVSTSTFNSLESTVNSNTATITSLSETVENKADSSTVTTLSNTVNSVQQTANSNSSKITNLTTVLGTNTDGTTSANDIVHKVSEIDQDLDSITTRVGKTEVLLTGTFATSSTAAATTAKVATITPAITGYTLTTGASITVKFTTANTSTAPTLNVNSTGAKAIRNYSGSALTAAEYSWKAGDTFDFVYDGQYWCMQDSTTATRLSSTETSISENAEAITLRATKTEVSNAISDAESYADSAVSTAKAEIKVTTDGITAEVNSLSTTVDGKADSSTVAALSQDLNGFKATVSSTYSTKTEVTDAIDTIEVGGRNLFRLEPKLYSAAAYNAYQINLTENLVAGETYTLQVWDIDVSHSGKTAAQLGISVYWGGGTVRLVNWLGTTYFTDGHADYLKTTFTVTSAQASGSGATNQWLNVYNSPGSASGTMSMHIGRWKIEKGNKATDWTPAPEDFQSQIDETIVDSTQLWYSTEAVSNTLTGDVVSFDDPEDEKAIKSITAEINAVQNLNGYSKPWVGGNGKNKLNPEASVQGKYVNQNGAVVSDARFAYSELIPVSEGNYVFSFTATDASVANCRVHAYDANGTWIRQLSATAFNSVGYKTVSIAVPSDTSYIRISYCIEYWNSHQLEVGSTATTYEPYENICPISGWDAVNVVDCGKNLFNPNAITTGKVISADGTISTFASGCYTELIPVVEGQTYTHSGICKVSGGNYKRIHGYKDGVWVQQILVQMVAYDASYSISFTIPTGVNGIRVSTGTADTEKQLELGSATDYEPYNGTTTTINLGSTIYGGTLDVTSGVLTVNKGYADLGDLTWTYDSGVGRFQATLSDKRTDVSLRTEQFMCSAYTSVTDGRPVAEVPDGSIYNAQGNPFIYVHDSRFTSASAFKTGVSGYQLVYDLATPTTVTLTPTQVQTVLGYNNLWADSGSVSVTYTSVPDAPTAPTAHVTNTDTVSNNWTKSVPEYSTNTPYIYYCYEFLKNDNTYSWSDVVLNNSVTGGIKYLENNINSQLISANQQIQIITENYSTIEQTNDSITSTVKTLETRIYGDGTSANKGSISELQTSIEQTSEKISFITSENQNTYAKMGSTFSFEGDTFKITTDGAEIHSEQGADFYKYVDTASNTVFGIDKNGTNALQANVTGQIGIGSGSVEDYQEQWAIRKGEYVSNVGYNLDFVWVGGNN